MDHDRAALDVGQLEVRRDDRSHRVAAGIDTHRRKVAFVALTVRSEVFAGSGRIKVSAGRQTCRWLAVRSGSGPAIRLDVNMTAMIARRQLGKVGHDHQTLGSIGNTDGADDFADATGADRIDGNVVGAGCAPAGDNQRSRKHYNVDFHQFPLKQSDLDGQSCLLPALATISAAKNHVSFTLERPAFGQKRDISQCNVHACYSPQPDIDQYEALAAGLL